MSNEKEGILLIRNNMILQYCFTEQMENLISILVYLKALIPTLIPVIGLQNNICEFKTLTYKFKRLFCNRKLGLNSALV